MSSQVGFHLDAKREMREAADFYDLERAGLGTEFLDAIEGAIQRVIERTVPRFPYSVAYSARGGGIFVSAIAHNSRRPFYWQDRL